MRQWPLVLLALLVPANAVSAVHYHTRTTTYACVDPRALTSRDPIARAQGRCFKVVPRETWERIARHSHSLLLLRIKPPHPGEPPLYFRRSNLVLIRPRHHATLHHRHGLADQPPASGQVGGPHVATAQLPSAGASSVTGALAGGAVSASPLAPPNAIQPAARQPAAEDQSSNTATITPDKPAPPVARPAAQAARPAGAPARNEVPTQAQAQAQTQAQAQAEPIAAPPAAAQSAPAGTTVHHEKTRARHLIWPLLLWAVMIGFAGLLVQLVLRRRPEAPAATPGGRRESATVPRSSIWEPVHPDLPGIIGKLETNATETKAHPQPDPEPETTEPAAAEPEPADAYGDAGRSASGHMAEPISLSDYKNGCVARLRHAGWDARTRFTGGQRGPDVIARHNGLVLALQCHPSASPVDVEAVEDACLVRERQRSDLAAIVSNASYTDAARQLAARTGIVLLHEDQLASFAA